MNLHYLCFLGNWNLQHQQDYHVFGKTYVSYVFYFTYVSVGLLTSSGEDIIGPHSEQNVKFHHKHMLTIRKKLTTARRIKYAGKFFIRFGFGYEKRTFQLKKDFFKADLKLY